MNVENLLFYKQYGTIDAQMSGAVPLRDSLLHREIPQVQIRKIEKPIIISKPPAIDYIVSKERIETDNIQLMIQNNDKLINFLSCVKSKNGIESVVFITDNCICFVIKSQNTHPVLIMKFPLNGITSYARSTNLVYDLPLDELFARNLLTLPNGKGYAFYYRTIDGVTSLHYEMESKRDSDVNNVGERTIEYVNLLLRPSLGTEIQKITMNSKNIDLMNSISLIMLSKVPSTSIFKSCNYIRGEESIELLVVPNPSGASTLRMTVFIDVNSTTNIPLVEEAASTTMIWKLKPNQSFRMNKRTLLLLMSVNNKIKVGTDSLYFALGRFGSAYVFLKLITMKPIQIPDPSAPIISMSKILEGIPHIYEMHFAY